MVGRRTGKFYRQNEAQLMTKLGLKPTINSGSGWIEKEDGISEFLIAQLKSTDALSIGVGLKDLHTLEANAHIAHKIPVFIIQFMQTEDIYVIAKPIDLAAITEYLETGRTTVQPVLEINDVKQSKPKKVITSGGSSRQDFWDERDKAYENRRTKK